MDILKTSEVYQGWTNRETHAVAAYLSNFYSQSMLMQLDQKSLEELVKSDIPKAGVYFSMALGSLWRVNWREISDSFNE